MFGNQTLLCQVVLPVRSCAAAIRLDRERTWRARPGGNATGFMLFEFSLSGKMAGLLKQIAPHVAQVAVLRDQTIATGIAQFSTIQALAPSLGVQVNPVNARNANEVENRIRPSRALRTAV